MEIKIQVLSTQIETKPTAKGSYQVVEVAYKDMTNGGKVGAKKCMSFTNKDVFNVISVAKPTEFYDVVMEKGEKYWEWTKVTRGVAASANSAEPATSKATASSATSKGGWETPSERAAKQVYIVRQSSLTNAIATLTVGRKGEIKPDEVIALAQQYEKFVFGAESVEKVVAKDVEKLDGFEDELDVPF